VTFDSLRQWQKMAQGHSKQPALGDEKGQVRRVVEMGPGLHFERASQVRLRAQLKGCSKQRLE
jgi:hypothetical protein